MTACRRGGHQAGGPQQCEFWGCPVDPMASSIGTATVPAAANAKSLHHGVPLGRITGVYGTMHFERESGRLRSRATTIGGKTQQQRRTGHKRASELVLANEIAALERKLGKPCP